MKAILFLVVAACSSLLASAQGGGFTISYPIGFPMSDLNDYISKASWRGINFEFNKRVKPQVVVGLETGWNVFYENAGEQQYVDKTVTLTGRQYRYTNSVPIIAGAKYFPKTAHENLRPYAGLGIGTLYSNRSTDFGLYRITYEAWQFALRPEAGLVYKSNSGVNPFVGVKYYWAFDGGDLDGQPYLTLNVGVAFTPY